MAFPARYTSAQVAETVLLLVADVETNSGAWAPDPPAELGDGLLQLLLWFVENVW